MRNGTMEKYDRGILFSKIQQKREKMYGVANDFGLNSDKTLSISQELDELINNYLKTKIKGVRC